jgi:CheY-like chemotaxis protein
MKKTVLVVDDDFFLRSLLNFLLRDHYEVVAAENGFKAMLWMDRGNLPDAIITDADMPDMDGFGFVKQLRKSGFYRNIPVMLLTGLPKDDLSERCQEAGFSGLLTKPFNPPQLLKQLEAVLSHSKTDSPNA